MSIQSHYQISRSTKESIKTPFLAFGAPVDEVQFRQIRNRLSLEFFKWDSQIGDITTLFRQPLLIDVGTWDHLKHMAEALAAELSLAESELIGRPELHAILGMPAPLQSVLRHAAHYGLTPAAVRTLRFDFHYSTDGWRISEVNSDVPGGYTEASAFTELMTASVPNATQAGNPASEWANAMLSAIGELGCVAFLSAVGFLEDQQVTAFLASLLRERNIDTVLLHHPAQLRWKAGYANTGSRGQEIELDAIVRFYQGEWLAKSARNDGWQFLFVRGKTPITNPGSALLTESKRLPLIWDLLSNSMPTWRKLLPESCDPRDRRWQFEDGWLLKMAYSNTGDEVHIRELMSGEAWKKLCRAVKHDASQWIAQRRFEPVPIPSKFGFVYPCIGVYVINGVAAGAYARVGSRQIIDYSAMDTALLIDRSRDAAEG